MLAKIDYGDKRKAVLDCIRSPSLEEGPCKNHFRPANADDTVVAIRTKPAVFFCLITDEALRSNPKKDLKDRSPLSYFINHLTDNEVSVYYVIGEHHTKAIAIEVNAKLLLVVEYFINHQKASPVTRLVDSLDTTYAISQEFINKALVSPDSFFSEECWHLEKFHGEFFYMTKSDEWGQYASVEENPIVKAIIDFISNSSNPGLSSFGGKGIHNVEPIRPLPKYPAIYDIHEASDGEASDGEASDGEASDGDTSIVNSDSLWDAIALSCTKFAIQGDHRRSLGSRKSWEEVEYFIEQADDDLGEPAQTPVEFINESLLRRLGIQYEIAPFEATFRLGHSDIARIKNLDGDKLKRFLWKKRNSIHFGLRNKKTGALVEITNVGTGISQVIPVIYACWLYQHGTSIFVQQPELHLHPKQQADLADVFIGALGAARLDCPPHIIAETHSEHFLLRLLRRIRETYKQERQGQATAENVVPLNQKRGVALRADQMAVIYVSQDEQGVSHYKHLRQPFQGANAMK